VGIDGEFLGRRDDTVWIFEGVGNDVFLVGLFEFYIV